MDPVTWTRPELFRPERFLDSDGELRTDTHIHPFQVSIPHSCYNWMG